MPLGPRDPVTCPKFAGHPTVPAETCVLRTFWLGKGSSRKKPAYPVCSTCPIGRLRKKQLEAGGWSWDLKAWRLKNAIRLRTQCRARRRQLSEHVEPPSAPVAKVRR